MYFTSLIKTNYKETSCIDLKRDLENFQKFLNSYTVIEYDFNRMNLNTTIGRARLAGMTAEIKDDKLKFWINVELECSEDNKDQLADQFIEKFREDFNDYLKSAREVGNIPDFSHHFLDNHFYVTFSEQVDYHYALQLGAIERVYIH